MNAVREWPIRDNCPKVVIGLAQESMSVVFREMDVLGGMLGIPGEVMESIATI